MDQINKHLRCFAAANTSGGFRSYYDEMFGGLDYLYIIKGGPGSGKSSFMKKISAKALSEGHAITEIYCSSDPKSLDGLIINDLNIGLTDGTAPHTRDPIYPGVKDEIINFGAHWDKEMLRANESEIISITDAKKRLYKKAYAYLAAADFLRDAARKELYPYVDILKIERAAERIVSKAKSSRTPVFRHVQQSAFSFEGNISLGEFSKSAKITVNISDRRDTAYIFMKALAAKAKESGVTYLYSCRADSDNEINELYFTESGTAVVIGWPDCGITVNTERFFNASAAKSKRRSVNHIKKCMENMYAGAESCLSEIKEKHSALEKIYTGSMDFGKTDEKYDELVKEIFK